MTTSSSSPRASRGGSATVTRDHAHPDTGKVLCSPPTPARDPPLGGLVVASRDHDDDAPVDDRLGSAPSGAVATDSDDARATSSSTEMREPASVSSAPLETHRGPSPARVFPGETASSRKETVAAANAAVQADAAADEETDAELDTPVSSSPDTSALIGGPDDFGALAGGAGDDAKALEALERRGFAGSPDSVLGEAARRASVFDSDSSADEAEPRLKDGRASEALSSASFLFPDTDTPQTAVDDKAGGPCREASPTGVADDDASSSDAKRKKTVTFASVAAWSVHDIGSCRDLSREKLAPTRGAGFPWLANPSGLGLRWLKRGLSALGVFGGGGMGHAYCSRDRNGDGLSRRSAAGKKCLLRRALRESRRNMRENVDYNAAYAEAVDGLNRAAEREAKARRQRERRRKQSARW